MADLSFFWHDYETFGVVPRRDRPAQFAGLRTDAELNQIDAPVTWYCKPAVDCLPQPEACLLTGILPQTCQGLGVAEHAFAAQIQHQLALPGTVGVGYNSIRFDDEVTRFLFWRTLLDPYAREWQHDCGRWDLLDVLRAAWALRPDGIEWPLHADGRPSFRLEDLSRANGLLHEAAHDALSDVHATLALARLLKARQPKLWDFCLRLRKKAAVLDEINQAQSNGRPFLHVSGRYGTESGCMALVWPLAPHPTNRNEIIVWNLAHDPSTLGAMSVPELRQRLFSKREDLPAGVDRLPVKTIHLNKSPVVIANLKTVTPAMAQRWGLDVDQGMRHAVVAASQAGKLAAMWDEVFVRPPLAQAVDVDEDLYGGFVGNEDRRQLERLRAMSPQALADKRPAFADPRLGELLFRYRARNFPETLSVAETAQWRVHCADRLLHGVNGHVTLAAFGEQLNALRASADPRGQRVLDALGEYASGLAAVV